MDWNPEQHYKNQAIASEYDKKRFSSIAGRVFNYLEKRIIAKCFAELPKDKIIVDIPSGTGRLAEILLEQGYKVHAIDISDEMLTIARERLAKYSDHFTTEVGDAKQLDQHPVQYDAALCARVLMHFPLDQQINFLRGVNNLSNGLVVINHSLNSRYQRFRRLIKKLLRHQASVNYPVTDEELNTLLSSVGLKEIKRYRMLPIISEAIYVVASKGVISNDNHHHEI